MHETNRLVPIIMAIALNRQKEREHIIIGEEYQVRSFLQGNDCAEILYNKEQRLGGFVINHQQQLDEDWNENAIYPLSRALKYPLERKNQQAAAWEYLAGKEGEEDPICLFTAYMCKYWYLQSLEHGKITIDPGVFEEKIMGLTNSFKQNLWEGKKYYLIEKILRKLREIIQFRRFKKDSEARIWYPRRKQNLEYIVVEDSFYPALLYYLTRLKDWKFCVCQCSVCGKYFIASSGHHSLCSAECRKIKDLQNKREFDERARQKPYNGTCKNTTQRMRNRINRLRKQNVSQELQEQVDAAFKAFQKEAIERKKAIKTKEDGKGFVDWLFEQEEIINNLCER